MKYLILFVALLTIGSFIINSWNLQVDRMILPAASGFLTLMARLTGK